MSDEEDCRLCDEGIGLTDAEGLEEATILSRTERYAQR